MKFLIITFSFMSYLPVHAGINFSTFGGATSGSSNTTISAGYDGEFELSNQVTIEYYFSGQSGRSQFTTSFVEGLPEVETKATNYGLSAGLTLFETASVSYDYNSESVNSGAVKIKDYQITLGLRRGNFRMSFGFGQRKVTQIKSFIMFPNLPALAHDYTDELAYTQGSHRFKLGYRFTDDFEMAIAHTRFSYDKNMESAYILLTAPTTYNSNGFDLLSQIYSLLDSSTEVSGVYNIGEMVDIEVSVGRTVDFYNPKAESSDVRLGTMIYQNPYFSWGIGITSTRASTENTPARSYDGTLAVSF